MEREDPLEKLERKELENKSNGGLKTIMIVMTVVAFCGTCVCLDVKEFPCR